jgi:hypothetical protein
MAEWDGAIKNVEDQNVGRTFVAATFVAATVIPGAVAGLGLVAVVWSCYRGLRPLQAEAVPLNTMQGGDDAEAALPVALPIE